MAEEYKNYDRKSVAREGLHEDAGAVIMTGVSAMMMSTESLVSDNGIST